LGKNRINFSQFIAKKGKKLKASLDGIFDKDSIESIARQTGFVQRKSRMNGRTFLDVLMFNSQQGCQSSLNELAEDFETHYGLSISKQGLDERFNAQGVDFLQQILSQLLTSTFTSSELINNKSPFKECLVRDSTRFGLPQKYASKYKGHGGATKTESMISIQYELDLLSGRQVDIQLTSGCRNDQQDTKESSLDIAQDTLLIRDLGYITSTYLQAVINQKAYFLNRLPSQMNIYNIEDNEEIDLERIYKKMKRHKLTCVQLDVLAGKKATIPCRTIVYLTDEKTARHRIKKTTKNTKSIKCNVSERQKLRSKLDVYMTNTTSQMIKAENVKQVYSLRWQIELIFKSWKSIVNVNKVKSMKIHRFECMLLAGLIWIISNWKFFQTINESYAQYQPEHSCSHWKFFKYVERHKLKLRSTLLDLSRTEELLEALLNLAQTKFYKETKKSQKPYLDTLKLLNFA